MILNTIKFNSLTQEQKNVVKVIFVNSDTDVVSDFYMKLDTIEKFESCYDTLLALGHYGITFFAKDNNGDFTYHVVS